MTALARLREVAVVRRNNRSDFILFGTMLLLSAFGLLMIYSATRSTGTFSMERQMIFVTAGFLIYVVISNIDYREYKSIAPVAALITLLALIAVFAFPPANGARRWIDLGVLKLQPAEFAKVVVIVVLAGLLAPSNRDEPTPRNLSWKTLGQAASVVAVPTVLIYLEPDLGTAIVFGFILFVMVYLAGASWRQMVTMLGAAAGGTAAIFQFGLLNEYQMNRLVVLWQPDIDPTGISYNLKQSMNAVGSGQILGQGLFSQGTLTDFEYVPEQETDFIFTAVAEQVGFVGGIIVLAAFAIIVWRLLVIAANARDRFGALIAAGIAAMVMCHVFINVGMTIGIMPVTGLPLPLLSQGGSFFMAMAFALGIANSIWLMRTPVPGENQLT